MTTTTEAELRDVLRRAADTAQFTRFTPFDPDRVSVEWARNEAPVRRSGRVTVVVLAAAAVLVAGVMLIRRDPPSDTDRTAVGAEPVVGESAVLLSEVEQIRTGDWVVPARNDGFEYEVAVDNSMPGVQLTRRIRFVSPDRPGAILNISVMPTSSLGTTQSVYGAPWHDVTIAGSTWTASTGIPPIVERTIGDQVVMVEGIGIEDRDVYDIASRLSVIDETELPYAVLRYATTPGAATPVAALEALSGTKNLGAIGDGNGNYCLQLSDDPLTATSSTGSTCDVHLPNGRALAGGGAEGPDPQLLAAGEPAQSILYGLARHDVARIEVHLADGSVLTSQPQDLNDSFPVNFYLVAIPAKSEAGFDQLRDTIAYDSEGKELDRITAP